MSKKTFNKLQQIVRMDFNKAFEIIFTFKTSVISKYKEIPLSQIIPGPEWRPLGRGQKGFVGAVFWLFHKELGFEYVGKGKSGTTNFYRWVKDVDDL